MIYKLIKHYKILFRILNQSKEIKRINEYKNYSLHKILKAFNKVKYSNFNVNEINSFKECETYRQFSLENKNLISYEVFGINKKEMVKNICRKGASKIKFCQLIYCIINKLNSSSVLEIGTNVGVSGSYILKALQNQTGGKFITMEGIPELCKISSKQFSSISDNKNYEIIEGLYDFTFPILLKKNYLFDFIFIDGNHKKKSTVDYFNLLKNKISKNTIFIFDDINWSKGMKKAWNIIINDDDVNYSIDLYQQGIVIIDKNDSNKNVNFKLHLSY